LLEPQFLESGLVIYNWPPPYVRPYDARQPVAPQTITFQAIDDESWHVVAATLVNIFDDTFQSLTLGNYRLIHSGDVKIYENLDVLPRAFFVQNWQSSSDVETALAIMAEPDFNPRETAVLISDGLNGQLTKSFVGEARIESYEPEQVVIHTNSNEAGLLMLTDANFEGWQASVDGEPVSIETADILFKSVFVPAGEHEVVFEYVSQSYKNGRTISLIGLLIFLISLVTALWKRSSIR